MASPIRVLIVDGARVPEAWLRDPRFELIAAAANEVESALMAPVDLVLLAASASLDLVRRVRLRARAAVLTIEGDDSAPTETVDLGPVKATQRASALDPRAAEAERRKSDLVLGIAQLAAGVAHEVNNPAAYVTANLQILDHLLEGVAKLVEMGNAGSSDLEPILREARELNTENIQGMSRISSIIKNLTAFSSIDQERVDEVRVNEVVNSACSIAYNHVRHRAQLIKALGDVPPIIADRGKLTQVVLNLLMNAAEAIEEGAADKHFIEIRTEHAGSQIVISVIDSGPGVSKELQHRIFEPFFTTKTGSRSTGLGLAVCVDIVRQHGGDIRVVSEEGRGSRFEVFLPEQTGLASDDVEPARLDEEEAGEVARGTRVLLIDDEILLLKAYGRMLADSCQVVTASGGQEALELLRYDPKFDAVICDLMMPHVDGPMVYEELERIAPELIPRMIFCSGGAFTPRVRSFIGSIANPLLEKPVRASALKAAIARLARP